MIESKSEMKRVLLKLTLLVSLFRWINGFAVYLTERDCKTSLEVGVVMMGTEVQYSEERRVIAKRGEVIIENGSTVQSFQDIEFEIEPKASQSILEVVTHGVHFIDGKCNGKRVLKKGSLELTSPQESSNPQLVTIVGGWAKSMTTGVKKTPNFTLYLAKSENDL